MDESMEEVPASPPPPTGLEAALALLRRRHGDAVVRRADAMPPGGAWAAGLPALDALLPGGGLPRGRISVLAGEGMGASGRLTLLQAMAATASREGPVAYVDLAGSLDPGFLADLGAELEACLVVRPPGGAMAVGLAMARTLVRAGVPWVGVALGRGRPAGPPAALGHALTALAGVAETGRAVICVAATAPLPAPLASASSLTLACRGLGWRETHGDVDGLRVGVRVTTAKIGSPGAEGALLLRYPRPQGRAEVVALPTLTAAPAVPVSAAPVLEPRPAFAAGGAG